MPSPVAAHAHQAEDLALLLDGLQSELSGELPPKGQSLAALHTHQQGTLGLSCMSFGPQRPLQNWSLQG